jgi:predicted GTPase
MIQINKNSQESLVQKIKSIGVYPIDIMITGATGSGKSSTINAISKSYLAKIGKSVEPETMDISSFRLNDELRFWDTPGLGDSLEKDKLHSMKIIDLLNKDYYTNNKQYGFIDVILIVLEGGIRDMGTVYNLINQLVIPNFPKDRIIVAINQADMAMKGKYWDKLKNKPEKELINFLEDKAISIKKRVKEATNIDIIKPIYYSAEYGYNVDLLLEKIVDCLPNTKRNL